MSLAEGLPAAVPKITSTHRPYAADVIHVDSLPIVRPYLAVWERERDERDHRHLQRERRRAAVLATLGQDYIPVEAA
ncbi:hypothetical protein [Streptomyces sp. TLI_55]|uniref:hypothetical protein n=1 Tax=Streptomyces sp. TLI_55 TaxID=1938861 RepID=UPI00211BFAC3|nr:hypothetical protein [Streptomyces sp. TLI_55]